MDDTEPSWLPPIPTTGGPRWVRDLRQMDRRLRQQPELNRLLVAEVARALTDAELGPMSAEQWLRTVLVQQATRYDDDEMGFRLNDSRFCRAFCNLPYPNQSSTST